MDWTKLTDTLKPFTEKAAPFIEKAKNAGFKALDFTQKQLQNTPIVLKTLEELTDLRTKKRVVLITYDQSHLASRDILLRSPIWSTQAWTDAAELRFVEASSGGDITTNLSITTPIDMRVWYVGEETFHSTDLPSILKWWESRCYDGKPPETSPVVSEKGDTPVTDRSSEDPLNGK